MVVVPFGDDHWDIKEETKQSISHAMTLTKGLAAAVNCWVVSLRAVDSHDLLPLSAIPPHLAVSGFSWAPRPCMHALGIEVPPSAGPFCDVVAIRWRQW